MRMDRSAIGPLAPRRSCSSASRIAVARSPLTRDAILLVSLRSRTHGAHLLRCECASCVERLNGCGRRCDRCGCSQTLQRRRAHTVHGGSGCVKGCRRAGGSSTSTTQGAQRIGSNRRVGTVRFGGRPAWMGRERLETESERVAERPESAVSDGTAARRRQAHTASDA